MQGFRVFVFSSRIDHILLPHCSKNIPAILPHIDVFHSFSCLKKTTCFFAFYLSQTIFDIPHMAWGSELAKTPHDKSSIFAWRSAAISLGVLLFYSVPFLPVFESRDITPQRKKPQSQTPTSRLSAMMRFAFLGPH